MSHQAESPAITGGFKGVSFSPGSTSKVGLTLYFGVLTCEKSGLGLETQLVP